ncbi:TonB-linked SusC/RagA family outer membrane protein [Salegentibacter sp. 24]|uniref:SusC/RagA family TonB-linked outer membrane protein n=1 Tax=Salegentibacter sp. 24 TaxID=2183986 RepID=UPI00105E9853|nr:TonB-dependent receptor [Salegentibacter sp. 24]TDN87421.1 TonB-linked SusC/RagA family outer membrane protein [Salegentibacter sp. 24]
MNFKFLILFLLPLSMWAQGIEVSGTVISEDDQMPLPGVTIQVEGTNKGVITDFDGNYTIKNVDPQATLVYSYLGFQTKKIAVNNQTTIDVSLKMDDQQLDDVVVTGYTSQRRTDITGAVSVVDMEELNKQPEPNPIRALQGRLPGVQITSDGSPSGSNTQVVIRGVGTLNNTDPLYVIDGVPTKAGMHELNPNNIESIQVLKDASSASIYGSRASNGVIIVTTKKGKEGVMQINLSTYVSTSTYVNRQEVLNAEQYGRVLWQAHVNDGIDPNSNNLSYQFDWINNENGVAVLNNIIVPEYLDEEQTLLSADTDWFDEISQTGFAQSYDLSVSNGTKKGSYLFSLGYYDNDGIVKTTNFNRISARMNSSYKLFNDRLEIGENFTFNKTEEIENPGVLDLALKASPIIPVRTVDGEGWGGPVGGMNDRQNPVRLLEYNKDNGYKYHRIFGNAYADLEFIENLHLRTNLGIDYSNFYRRSLQRSYKSGYLQNDETAVNIEDWKSLKWTWTNTATYELKIKKHDFNLLAGMEMFRDDYKNISLRREGFILESPEYMYPDAGSGEAFNGGSATSYSLLSFFGKIDYTFDRKYLLSGTIRRDGSSRFGENNRFGTFPAFSAGWRISEEDFIQDNYSFLSDLKLRLGWGQTGNQEIDNNAIYSLYVSDYAGGDPTWGTSYGTAYDLSGAGSGLLPSGFRGIQLGNDNLKWETTTQTNVGLDFGFFGYTLFGNIDYYFKETEDILVLPPYLGTIGEGGNRWVNGASMENEGWEFAITYRDETEGEFRYEISANISTNRNEITYLPEEVQNSYGGDGGEDNILGRPINSMYGYVADGLFTTEEEVMNAAEQEGKGLGRIRYRDLDGDGVITDDDRTWIGIPHPDFNYGFNITLGYRNFDFTSFWQGVGNVDVINNRKFQTDFWSVDDVGSNKGTRLLDAWSQQNVNSSIPALTTIDSNAESRFSTYYVENGRYLKLRNLQVGYSLSDALMERMNFTNARIYVSGQNLLMITSSDFTGVDPENAGWGYPQPLTLTMGLNLSL